MRPIPCLLTTTLLLWATPALPAADDSEPRVACDLPATVTSREWKLKSIVLEGKEVALPKDNKTTLSVNVEGRISGKAPVNRYFGRIIKADATGAMQVGPGLGCTRMAGPPEAMQAEADFLKALAAMTRYRVEAKTLVLEGPPEAKTTLTFTTE